MKNPIVLIFAGILGAIAVFTGVFVMVLSGNSSKTNVNKSKPVAAKTDYQSQNKSIGTQKDQPTGQTTASAIKDKTEDTSLNKINNWEYKEMEDKIHNAKYKIARTTSINTLNFDFPYSGAQHAHLIVRRNYDGSKEVMLTIEQGQFMASAMGGNVLVRFDDNPPKNFGLTEPADSSTTVVFIHDADYFIKELATARKAYLQTDFFQEGRPTLEFAVEGLNEL